MNPVVSRIHGSDEQVLVLDVLDGQDGLEAVIVHEGGQLGSCLISLLTIEYADGQSWPIGFRFNSLAAEKARA